MGAVCGPGGCKTGCCGAGVAFSPPPVYPEGYGLVCCGLPAGCCGYGSGLGPGGPCSCAGDCCGSGQSICSGDCCGYLCGCCDPKPNDKCCGCGNGAARSKCGGFGYCGGGTCPATCCGCCINNPQPQIGHIPSPYPVYDNMTPMGLVAPVPQSLSYTSLMPMIPTQPHVSLVKPIPQAIVVNPRNSRSTFRFQQSIPQSLVMPPPLLSQPISYQPAIQPIRRQSIIRPLTPTTIRSLNPTTNRSLTPTTIRPSISPQFISNNLIQPAIFQPRSPKLMAAVQLQPPEVNLQDINDAIASINDQQKDPKTSPQVYAFNYGENKNNILGKPMLANPY